MTNLNMLQNNTGKSWENYQHALTCILSDKGIKPKPVAGKVQTPSYYFGDDKGKNTFFLLPLRQIENLRNLRKKANNNNGDYSSPVIFLTTGAHEKPDSNGEWLWLRNDKAWKEMFGNPHYGNISQAILKAEVPTDKFRGPSSFHFFNILNIFEQPNDKPLVFPSTEYIISRIDDIIRKSEKLYNYLKVNPDTQGNFRCLFYKSFIEYYFPYDMNSDEKNWRESGKIQLSQIPDDIKDKFPNCQTQYTLKDIFDYAEALYCKLHVLNFSEKQHTVTHEMWRAPISFDFFDMLDARNTILNSIGTQKSTIKLLLIDNKVDDKKESIETLLKYAQLEDYGVTFEISALPECRENKNGNFNWKKFKEGGSKGASDTDRNYHQNTLDCIKNSHFILLDFFLNEANSFLAFDFINMLNANPDSGPNTIWYFITSAVHDSVTRYAHSGLLAEYYESAVVNAGDDPTNDQRKIIFLYKLLTFVRARLDRVQRNHNLVLDRFFKDNTLDCPKCRQEACSGPGMSWINCFNDVQRAISHFRAEERNFTALWVRQYDEIEPLFRLLDDTLNKFKTLPQADWQIIQHQVDFIRTTVRNYDLGEGFCCPFINRELQVRSEVY